MIPTAMDGDRVSLLAKTARARARSGGNGGDVVVPKYWSKRLSEWTDDFALLVDSYQQFQPCKSCVSIKWK